MDFGTEAAARAPQGFGLRAALKTPFEPEPIPRMLADRTGTRVVVLAPSVGAVPQAHDYLSLFEYNVAALARALKTSF
jgi:hypothetical protein